MKACKSVPSWKHFSCQNMKAGNIFNINLFLHLSLTCNVSVRNGCDAVQICSVFSLSLFAVVRWCQLGSGSVPSLLSTRLEQSMCPSLFLPIPLLGHHLLPSESRPQDAASSPAPSPLSLHRHLRLPLIPGSSSGGTTNH